MAVLPRRIEFSPSTFHGYVSNETRKDEVQPSMKLRSFRVQNYRCIDDSGEAPVEHIKALVGKNESGKTSILRALHTFNPASPEPYKGLKEFPRRRFHEYEDKAPVVELKFSLDPRTETCYPRSISASQKCLARRSRKTMRDGMP